MSLRCLRLGAFFRVHLNVPKTYEAAVAILLTLCLLFARASSICTITEGRERASTMGRESPRNVFETNVSLVIFILILADLPNHNPFPSALLIHN